MTCLEDLKVGRPLPTGNLAAQLFFVANLVWSIFKAERILRPAQNQT
jgi:hypothetical protein